MPSTDIRLELKEKTSMAQNAWQASVYANGLRDCCTFTILQNIRNNMHNNTTSHPARLYNFRNTAVRTAPLTKSTVCQSKIQTDSNWSHWHLKEHYATVYSAY